MGRFSVPSPPKMSQIQIDTFLGADLTNEPGYISPLRSPDCPNMIRESSGKVRKWIGYKTVKQYDGQINGCHIFYKDNENKILYHAGTKLYENDTVLYQGMANNKSQSKQLNGKLYIFDGYKLLVYHKTNERYECVTAESIAYIPKIFISKSPKGEASFALAGSYQGTGGVSKYSFGVLETEPLFLTDSGIFAVTPSDVLGERFAQNRSYYLNGLLLKQDLKNAYSCIYDGFYMLACGQYIFALDGTQATR